VAQLHGRLHPAWLAGGVGVAGLLWVGPWGAPAIFAASLAVDLQNGCPLPAAIIAGLANTLLALIPVLVLGRIPGFSNGLERFSDAVWFLAIASLAAPVVGAILGTVALQFDSAYAAQALGPIWLQWFWAEVAGVSLVAPLILAWRPGVTGPRLAASLPEIALLATFSILAMLAASQTSLLVWILFFPLVAWAAVRTGLRGATLVTLTGFVAAELWHWRSPHVSSAETMSQVVLISALVLAQGSMGILLSASTWERRRSRIQERQVEDAYRALIAASPIAITGLDAAGRVTIWSKAAERLFGWTEPEAIGRPLPSVPPEREAEFRRLHREVGDGAVISGFQTTRMTKGGQRVEVSVHAWPLFDSEGRPIGTMAAAVDVTERNEIERLQQATFRIALAAQSAPTLDALYGAIHAILSELMPARNLFIALHDPVAQTMSFPYWVDERDPRPAPRRLGRGLTEYVLRTGAPLRSQVDDLDRLVALGEVDRIGAPAVDWMGVPLRAGDRSIGVLAVQAYEAGIRYSDRQLAMLAFVSAQIAMGIERRRAEEGLRASDAEFRALFRAMRDVILVFDRNGRHLRIAPSTSGLLVAPADELLGRLVEEVLPAEAAQEVRRAIGAALDGQGPVLCRYAVPIQGEDRWFEAVATALGDDTVMFVARDVTEQRRAEDALRQSEAQLRQATKMEAVGRLAGGVAHDFNNLLTAVIGHTELALSRLRPADTLAEDLREIKDAAVRAAGLTQQLLAFSRKQVLEPRIVNLNVVVTGLVRMLRRTIGEDVELVTRLAPDLGRVRADPTQLEQVLLNLAVNARDAMPDGGRLTISTTNVQLGEVQVVRALVSDTGVGMSEEVLTNIFEPFYTTKAHGKGTGLGLATVYGIIQQSGGQITVQSSPGQGSTFMVDLPQVSGEVEPFGASAAGAVRSGWQTILLVEDDEAVRGLTRRVLEQYGYRVLPAADGEGALALSRSDPELIHLLLTDVVMPGMNGPQLADRLRAERPGIRVMLMSGYAADSLEGRHAVGPDSAFLQKPFSPEALIRRVQHALDSAPIPPAPRS
jgi:two-component system, cell cycle sensor histidine kinase and response regulator CckA